MVAEWPQNWALQRFPVGKWLAGNLIVWYVERVLLHRGLIHKLCDIDFYRGGITLLHIPCNNFASLFVVRFLLGLSEACIVPAFLLSMSMFFTYQEQAIMMSVMWSIGNSSPITSGFLSYGVLWIKTGSFHPWKWLMGTYNILDMLKLAANLKLAVITGVLTIIFGIFVYLLFPDSPLHATFLTYEERAQAVLRIKENNSGIENKHFKKHQ